MLTNKLILEIIAALEGWEHDPDAKLDPRTYMVKPTPDHPGKPRFTIHLNNQNRLSISGNYPTFPNGATTLAQRDPIEPYITCDPRRGAAAIARDITRRFLPRFRELHQIRTHRLSGYQETRTQLEQQHTETIKLLNTTAETQIARTDPTYLPNLHYTKIWLQVDLDAGHLSGEILVATDTMDIQLRATPQLMGKALLETLATQIKQHRRIHISEVPASQRTNTYLPIINLWDDPYHHKIVTAAHHLTTQHPAHTWRYLGQSATTLWVATDDDNIRVSI